MVLLLACFARCEENVTRRQGRLHPSHGQTTTEKPDLHNKTFCVDVSKYGDVVYVPEDVECCRTILKKNCTWKEYTVSWMNKMVLTFLLGDQEMSVKKIQRGVKYQVEFFTRISRLPSEVCPFFHF